MPSSTSRWVGFGRAFALTVTGALAGCGSAEDTGHGLPQVVQQHSGTTERLQAISVVSDKVVWASGLGGTFSRTTDGGESWTTGVVPGAETLQFRDVDALDSATAYLLSSGSGDASRIYKTVDGGRTWTLQFTNTEPEGFFDCMAFWDASSGVAFSDAVDGEFLVVRTVDGEHWEQIDTAVVPDALPGEGSFAASGTCLVTDGDSTAWFGTGASQTARIFKTSDRGATWSVYDTPIVSGTSTSGIAALGFRDAANGMAAGGEISEPGLFTDNVAVTADGGRSWVLAGRPTFPGAVYGLAYVAGSAGSVVSVGPGGASYSFDDGATWHPLDTLEYWSAGFASPGHGWLVGPEGRIAKVDIKP